MKNCNLSTFHMKTQSKYLSKHFQKKKNTLRAAPKENSTSEPLIRSYYNQNYCAEMYENVVWLLCIRM